VASQEGLSFMELVIPDGRKWFLLHLPVGKDLLPTGEPSSLHWIYIFNLILSEYIYIFLLSRV
jgi:hypothetical protein